MYNRVIADLAESDGQKDAKSERIRPTAEKTEGTVMIRKAAAADIDAVASVYEHIHTAEEAGEASIGWIRGVYPERETALAALERGDLFVETDRIRGETVVVGTAILNQVQVDVYEGAPWLYDVPADQVMVMHTLVIDPFVKGHGYGRRFAEYYEQYALSNGCHYLRIDTNARNTAARAFYKKLRYEEIDIVPCEFNGIPDVKLVLLEKRI